MKMQIKKRLIIEDPFLALLALWVNLFNINFMNRLNRLNRFVDILEIYIWVFNYMFFSGTLFPKNNKNLLDRIKKMLDLKTIIKLLVNFKYKYKLK